MQWLRLHHDTPDDQKWRLVAVRSGQPVGNILAVWMMMMICASKAEDRGTLEGWNDEIAAAVLGYRLDEVMAIRLAMTGLVLENDRLTGWNKRQRQGSDDAAERKRRSRAQKSDNPPENGPNGSGHGPNGANGADHHGNDDVPLPSRDNEAMSRDNSPMSRDSHATVTGHLSRAKTPDSKKEDSVAVATGPVGPSPTLKSELFRKCLEYLTEASGRPAVQLRKMIGRWIGQHGEGAVLEAIALAQRESAVSPVGFVEKVLQKRGNVHPLRPRGGDRTETANERILRRQREVQEEANRLYGDPL